MQKDHRAYMSIIGASGIIRSTDPEVSEGNKDDATAFLLALHTDMASPEVIERYAALGETLAFQGAPLGLCPGPNCGHSRMTATNARVVIHRDDQTSLMVCDLCVASLVQQGWTESGRPRAGR